MSCRGRRISAAERIERFDWHDETAAFDRPLRDLIAEPVAETAPAPAGAPDVDLASLERDAFARGFAQGECSGAEASATRTDALLRRLTHTLEDLARLRAEVIRKTERQVVQLAIAVATRIVRREIALDRELLVAMARVALDRLGDSASARIRLHPDDCAAVERLGSAWPEGGPVQIVPDAHIHRGGCVVESDFGLIDVSVDAQVEELTRSLLSADDPEAVPVHTLTADAPRNLEF